MKVRKKLDAKRGRARDAYVEELDRAKYDSNIQIVAAQSISNLGKKVAQ